MLHNYTSFDDLGGSQIEFLLVSHEICIFENRNLSEVKKVRSNSLFTFPDDELENIARCMRSRSASSAHLGVYSIAQIL